MLALVAATGCDGNGVAPPESPARIGGDTVVPPSPLCNAIQGEGNGMTGGGVIASRISRPCSRPTSGATSPAGGAPAISGGTLRVLREGTRRWPPIPTVIAFTSWISDPGRHHRDAHAG